MLKSFLAISAICVSGMAAVPAAAQTVTAAKAGAHALSVDIATRPVVGASATLAAGPVAASQGRGPAAFAETASVASGSGALGLRLFELGAVRTDLALGTGALTSSVSGNAAGATARAGVANLGLSITQRLADLLGTTTLSLLSVKAGALGSTASFDVASGAFAGATTVTGLSGITTLGTLGLGVGGVAGGSFAPAANSVLLSALGLTVTLNEQILSGDRFTVNAMSLRFNNFLAGTNLVSGAIILGQSQVERVQVAAPPPVPEPATWATMIAGFAMIGAGARLRRRAAAVA